MGLTTLHWGLLHCTVTADGKLFSPSGLADEKQKTVSHCSHTHVRSAQTLAGDNAQETIKGLNDPWKEELCHY